MEDTDVEIDRYGLLTIAIPKSRSNSTIDTISYSSTHVVYIKNDFFESKCRKNEDDTRNLILKGGDLFLEIKRYLQSWDAPYLRLFLKKNHDVTRINLSYNQIDSFGFIDIIKYVINDDHILEIDCRYNNITESGISYLLNNGEKLKLKVLQLSGNKIGNEGAMKVALTMQKNIYIERLEVADIDQTEESLIYFTTILRTDQEYHNKSLKILDLSRPITECLYYKFNSQHIAEAIGSMLRSNASLEELYLQKFSFSCHDIEAMIEDAKYNRTLKCLDFRCNNIGDHGMEILSKWLQQGSTLQTLLLGHNIITNHGIRALSRAISVSRIIILDVSYNRFNDEGCSELLYSIKKIWVLRQLQIYGNKIGHKTAKIIQQMLLSTILNQDRIDVEIYEVDDTLHLAYRECQTF
ncbi:FERM domain-containing protein C-like [Phymastichus coffea]|uniref:FERM domain-containing protein C-like n=1 Tax=Phymastichus coffea TaxID=108790 RepID=UPI00273C1907|nr:FERM domain-containing protein C-like [Phymastichus coffea]